MRLDTAVGCWANLFHVLVGAKAKSVKISVIICVNGVHAQTTGCQWMLTGR